MIIFKPDETLSVIKQCLPQNSIVVEAGALKNLLSLLIFAK